MSASTDVAAVELVQSSLADGVLTVTLADEAGRNVLSVPLMQAFLAVLDEAENDAEIRLVVVTNLGGVFCAGADLKAAPGNAAPDIFATLLRRIQTCAKPVIGKIAGHAMGGGLGLAAAFDISVAAEDAKFGFSEVRLGVVPAVISAICLPKLRRGDAMELFLRGNRFSAASAAGYGLITRAAPRKSLDQAVAEIIADIILGGPVALSIAKRLVEEVPAMDTAQALAEMTKLSAAVFASPEARAGTQAFRERRSPPWVK